MTRLLEIAVEAARQLSDEEQDELARTIMQVVGGAQDDVYVLTEEDEAAIDRGLAELERGRYATLDDLKTTLSKYRR